MPAQKFTKGVKKARIRFAKFYGKDEGRRIFFAKAEDYGRGKTVIDKVNSVYKKGAKLPKRSR